MYVARVKAGQRPHEYSNSRQPRALRCLSSVLFGSVAIILTAMQVMTIVSEGRIDR